MPLSGATLYGYINVVRGEIFFDANGASGTPPGTIEDSIGITVPLPDQGGLYVDDERIFLGWGLTSDATEVIEEYEITGLTVTLFAIWAAEDDNTPPTLQARGGTSAVVDRTGPQNYIYGLAEGLDAAGLEERFVDVIGNGKLTFEYPSGNFGTGTIVRLVDLNDSNIVYETFFIIIFGDIDGDGLVTGNDLARAKSGNFTTAPQAIAANVSMLAEGDVFDGNDVLRMKTATGSSPLDQGLLAIQYQMYCR